MTNQIFKTLLYQVDARHQTKIRATVYSVHKPKHVKKRLSRYGIEPESVGLLDERLNVEINRHV